MPGGARRHSHRRHKHHHKEDGEKPNQDPERPSKFILIKNQKSILFKYKKKDKLMTFQLSNNKPVGLSTS